jgi:hypothetical protein
VMVVDSMQDLVEVEYAVDDWLGDFVELEEGVVFEYAFAEVLYWLDVNFKQELVFVGGVVQLTDALVDGCFRVGLDLAQGDYFAVVFRLLSGWGLLNPHLHHFIILA